MNALFETANDAEMPLLSANQRSLRDEWMAPMRTPKTIRRMAEDRETIRRVKEEVIFEAFKARFTLPSEENTMGVER